MQVSRLRPYSEVPGGQDNSKRWSDLDESQRLVCKGCYLKPREPLRERGHNVSQPRVEVFPLSSDLLFPNQLVQTEQEEPVHLECTHTLTVLPHPQQHCTACSFSCTPSRTAPRIRLHRQTWSCNQGSHLTSQTRSAHLDQHLLAPNPTANESLPGSATSQNAQRLLGSTTLPANECFQTQRAYCIRLITSQRHITFSDRTYKSKI